MTCREWDTLQEKLWRRDVLAGGKDSGISCNITREHPAEIEM